MTRGFSMTLTVETLAKVQEIRARLEAATPGPWTVEDGRFAYRVYAPTLPDYAPLARVDSGFANHAGKDAITRGQSARNGEFIAHAPEDISFLLGLLPQVGAGGCSGRFAGANQPDDICLDCGFRRRLHPLGAGAPASEKLKDECPTCGAPTIYTPPGSNHVVGDWPEEWQFDGVGATERVERSADAPEPHDGDVSRLLRIWAKPLRGLLNRPDDALALERAADVIESGGMDSVFRVSRSPTGEETHERT